MSPWHKQLQTIVHRHVSDDLGTVHTGILPLLQEINDTYLQLEALLPNSSGISASTLSAMLDAGADLYTLINQHGQVILHTHAQGHPLLRQPKAPIGSLADLLDARCYQAIAPMLQHRPDDPKGLGVQFSTDQGVHYWIQCHALAQGQWVLQYRDVSAYRALAIDPAVSRFLHQSESLLTGITKNLALYQGNLSSALQQMTEAAAQALSVQRASIWFFTPQRDAMDCFDLFDVSTGEHAQGVRLQVNDFPVYFEALNHGRSIAAHDALRDPRTREFAPQYLPSNHIHAMLDAPIHSQGQVIGVLCCEHTHTMRQWGWHEEQFAASLADIISTVYHTYQHQQLQNALDESEERFRTLADTTDSTIFVFRNHMIYANPAMVALMGMTEFSLAQSDLSALFGQAFVQRFAHEDIQQAYRDNHRIRLEVEVNAYDHSQRRLFLSVGVTQYQGDLAWMASAFDITDRRLMEAELEHQTLYDHLTNLPNRRLLMQRLKDCMQRLHREKAYQFAVLFLDLDRFKMINDSLGHEIGDKFLVQVTQRLVSTVRSIDLVARLGGDEFVILLTEVHEGDNVLHIANRIQQSLSQAIAIDQHAIICSVSIGIAFSQRHYTQAEHIVRDADIAMSRAKEQGKACYSIFDEKMHKQAKALLTLENDLRLAVQGKQFCLYYQPLICLQSAQTLGFEALIRWPLANGTMRPPNEFIPQAEESGIIVDIGAWVIEAACQCLLHWRQHSSQSASISINLSVKQFNSAQLVGMIQQQLNDNHLDPRYLKLELTESMLMGYSDSMVNKLSQLKALGCELLIDDFGTGYSSLSYLNRFPIDCIKIDRSFVAGMDSQADSLAIVQAIISMAQNLNLKVVAEGVETQQQLQQLMRLGCHYAQGFLFSKPVPQDQALSLIGRRWAEVESVLSTDPQQ